MSSMASCRRDSRCDSVGPAATKGACLAACSIAIIVDAGKGTGVGSDEKTRPRIGEWTRTWAAVFFAVEVMAAASWAVVVSLADFITGTGTLEVFRTVEVVEDETGGGGEVEMASPSLATSFGGGARAGAFLAARAFEGAVTLLESMVKLVGLSVIHLVIYINTVVVTSIDRFAIVYWII